VTYLVLTVVVLALVAVACVPVLRRLPFAPLAWTGLILLAMTAVFDSAIVGYGLTVYDPETILGVYVGAAPIEDFGYTVAAVMIMPTLWTVLGRRSGRAEEPDAARSDTSAGASPDTSAGAAAGTGPSDAHAKGQA